MDKNQAVRIIEVTFEAACKNGTVSKVSIVDSAGGFVMLLEFADQPGKQQVLYTQRGRVRTWSSLQSVWEYVKRCGYTGESISVLLADPVSLNLKL